MMEKNNDATTNPTPKLDIQALLNRAEIYKQQKSAEAEKNKSLPLKLDIQALLIRAESYRQQKANQPQISNSDPIKETLVIETQIAAPPVRKSLLQKFTNHFALRTPNNQPDVPADPRKRELLKLGLAGAAILIGGGGLKIAQALAQPTNNIPQEAISESSLQASLPAPTIETLVEKTKPVEILPASNPHLGFRNDIPELMVWVRKAGASSVRIDGDTVNLKQPNALNEAKRLELNVLYVFHPIKPLSASEVDTQLKSIFNTGANITLEIGNEPDDVTVQRWQYHDLDSFGRFAALVLERMDHLKSSGDIPQNAKSIVGALTNQNNTEKLLSSLKLAGIKNPEKLTYAIHAYNSPEDVKNRVNLVNKVINGAQVMITEMGTNNVDANNQPIMNSVDTISDMYASARDLTHNPIFIHQLPYTERDPLTKEGYGFVEMNGTPLASFDKLKEGLGRVEKQKSSKENPQDSVGI